MLETPAAPQKQPGAEGQPNTLMPVGSRPLFLLPPDNRLEQISGNNRGAYDLLGADETEIADRLIGWLDDPNFVLEKLKSNNLVPAHIYEIIKDGLAPLAASVRALTTARGLFPDPSDDPKEHAMVEGLNNKVHDLAAEFVMHHLPKIRLVEIVRQNRSLLKDLIGIIDIHEGADELTLPEIVEAVGGQHHLLAAAKTGLAHLKRPLTRHLAQWLRDEKGMNANFHQESCTIKVTRPSHRAVEDAILVKSQELGFGISCRSNLIGSDVVTYTISINEWPGSPKD